jgi:cell wall-associated NlpC family hydrolase
VTGPKQIHTPVGTAPVLPVMVIAMGAYLTWFGVHYWRSDTAWPSDPVKAVLTGKSLPVKDTSAQEAALSGIVQDAQQAQAAKEAAAAAGLAGLAGLGGLLGPAAAMGGSVSGTEIANKALNYVGAGYVFGGKADRIGNWDCSSFVSYVLGHDCGLPLPGGKWGDPGFPPHAHGPATGNYMMFGKPVSASQVQKGDLVVNSEHMGIVVTAGTYMSAKTPSAGTGLGLYTDGFPGGAPVFRRVV